MSDHIPRSQAETNQYLSDETNRTSSYDFNDSFFNSNWSYVPKIHPPLSPIYPLSEESKSKLSDYENPTAARQVGIVSPSRSDSATNKDMTLIESSRTNISSIISLLNEYVISHPFMVIRRQCQVNNRSRAYHLTPLTVIPLMLRLQSQQGFSTFFKGLPSVLVNYVLLIGCESFFYNLLQFPIEYDFSSINSLFSTHLLKHLALKGLSILVATPFICSSAVETVQSWIVGESPYPLEHIKEGLYRVVHFGKDRKLPFYRLVGPSIAYHLCYYVLYSLIRQAILHFYYDTKEPETQKADLRVSQFFDESSRNKFSTNEVSIKAEPEKRIMNELKSSLYANMLADIITYPFQNILYRLFLQGTRTLIDNVDGSTAVTPLITNYDSASDCYQTILQTEGSSGLFKGFGALILQYTVQTSVLYLTDYCIDFLLKS